MAFHQDSYHAMSYVIFLIIIDSDEIQVVYYFASTSAETFESGQGVSKRIWGLELHMRCELPGYLPSLL